MWTIAEIAEKIMKYSSPQSHRDEKFESVELPEKYFQKQPNDFTNNKIYLPKEFMNNTFQINLSSNVSETFFESVQIIIKIFFIAGDEKAKSLQFHKLR